MECRWLGHKRWAWEDKLEISPICVILQGLQCGWLPMGRPIPCLCLNHNQKLVGSVWCLAPLWWSEKGLCLGSEEPCDLWLLPGFWTLSNYPRGVFIESMGLICLGGEILILLNLSFLPYHFLVTMRMRIMCSFVCCKLFKVWQLYIETFIGFVTHSKSPLSPTTGLSLLLNTTCKIIKTWLEKCIN